MRFFAIFTISFFLSIPAFSQFPEYPFNRIQLGTQTEANKYLVVPTDSIPDWTPADGNDAIMAFDTLGEIMYLFKSGAWEKFNPAFTDLSLIGTTGFQDFIDNQGVSSIVGGVGVDVSSVSGTPYELSYTLITNLSEFSTNLSADGNEELPLVGNQKVDIQTLLENVLVAGSNITLTALSDNQIQIESTSGSSFWEENSVGQLYYNAGGIQNVLINRDSASDSRMVLEVQGQLNVKGGEVDDSQAAIINIGANRQVDGNAFFDLVADASAYPDYGARFIRLASTGTTQLAHRGSGDFEIKVPDNGNVRYTRQFNNVLMYYEGITGNVGVRNTDPDERLHVTGSIRMENGSEATGSVVISDANGTLDHTTTPESLTAFSGWDTDASDDYSDSDIDGTEAAFSGWDKNESDDFDGAWSSLTGVPAGFADDTDDVGITNVTVGVGLDVSGTSTKDIDLDFSELDDVSTVNGLDEFVMRTRFNGVGSLVATNARVNVQDLLANTLVAGSNISITQTGSGSTITIASTGSSGDITAVTAGDMLDGGGSTGSVTLDVDLSEAGTVTSLSTTDHIIVSTGAGASGNEKISLSDFIAEFYLESQTFTETTRSTDISYSTYFSSNPNVREWHLTVTNTNDFSAITVTLPTPSLTHLGKKIYVVGNRDIEDVIITAGTTNIYGTQTGSLSSWTNFTVFAPVMLVCMNDPDSADYIWVAIDGQD